MDGLRARAQQKFLREQKFKDRPADLYKITTPLITIAKFKTETQFFQTQIPWDQSKGLCDLINKPICNRNKEPAVATLKLAKLGRDIDGTLSIDQELFMDMFEDFGFDPYWLHLVHCSVYGHFFLPKQGGALYTFYFHSVLFTLLWSHNVHEKSTKVIIIPREVDMTEHQLPVFTSFYQLMEHHQALVGDWRFCSFLCATQLVYWIEDSIEATLQQIRSIETRTDHGAWRVVGGVAVLPGPDELGVMSKEMGEALTVLANIVRHASIAKAILSDLSPEPQLPPCQLLASKASTTQSLAPQSNLIPSRIGQSTTTSIGGISISGDPSVTDETASAVLLLKNQIGSSELQASYLQERARTQQEVIFNLLARHDAESSKDIAQAALNDSFSMKTIAIMTMLFLPGSFFATLFAMPLLKWDSDSPQVIQRQFWIYWAFSLPCTALVILIWDLTSNTASIFSKCWRHLFP